jgi:dephospho-CoA kinase
VLLIGLTGSIGMGKSETARMFASLGVPVYDADAAVHELYDRGGAAVDAVGKAFPGVVRAGRVDRSLLSSLVLASPEALRKLETIVHPLAGEAQRRFLRAAKAAGHEMVVLDIPLLFERGGHSRMDVVVVVSAPAEVQKSRVLAREGMTEEKLASILSRQTPDEHKRAQADFIIDTSRGFDFAGSEVQRIINALKGRSGMAYERLMASAQESESVKIAGGEDRSDA